MKKKIKAFLPKKLSQGIYSIIVLKVIIMGIFTSEYSLILFRPFVSVFTEANLNPWQYYLENGLNLDAFPYHSLMLYLLTPSMFLIKHLNIDNIIISNLIFKLPLLVADLVILFAFLKLFPLKKRKVFIYYFCNPIIIYAIYIHSQLDIIPMALLFLGIYSLTLDKLRQSALLIGLALATKLHILVALPLLFFYLIRKHKINDVIIYFSIVIGVFIFLDFPFAFSEGFQQMVLFNPKQSLLFDSYLNIGKLKFLLPIASIVMVYIHFFNQKRVNQDLLFFYFGVLFTATLFFIHPAPAWYIWLVPFISIYFINSKNEKKTILFYVALSIVYLTFFMIFYQPDYKDILFLGDEVNFKVDNVNFSNSSFTLLLSMLLAVMYAFYKYGIKSNSIYNKQSNLTIGIGGDSAVGKSTLLDQISSLLGNRLLVIEGDGEHKWERGDENWSKYTHLNPKANFIHKQAEVIHELKLNNSIFRSDYDHSTGKFTTPSKIDPKEFIAISGLHPFYLPKQRKNIDLKIFMDTDNNLRKHWKILRDIDKRSYSVKKVLDQIETRNQDGEKFIIPQKDFADLIIEYFSIGDIKIGESSQIINLGLKIVVDANLHLDKILSKMKIDYVWDYNKDLKTQFVILKQEPKEDFKLLANEHISNIHEIIVPDAKWLSGYNGLVQMVCLMMISEKLKEV
jgi:uridine kinase